MLRFRGWNNRKRILKPLDILGLNHGVLPGGCSLCTQFSCWQLQVASRPNATFGLMKLTHFS